MSETPCASSYFSCDLINKMWYLVVTITLLLSVLITVCVSV